MPSAQKAAGPTPPRRRADAERNIARILDASADALAGDPDASMAEIARRAGVVRATIYVHFPTREALLEAVSHRAFAEVTGVIEAADPQRGEPAEALARVVAATWQTLGRYHGLIAVSTQAHDHDDLRARHRGVLGTLQPLIERGQADGIFRSDVPAEWHLSMFMAIVHAASAELRSGRLPEEDAQAALTATILGAVADNRASRSVRKP